MSIKIGIDAFPFQEKPTGIGKYIINLVEDISRHIPNAKYFAYSNRKIILSDYLESNVIKREYLDKLSSKMPGKVWLKLFSGKFIKEDNLDFYISTSGFFPVLPSHVKKIAIIHDLNYKLVPSTMGRLHLLTYLLFFKRDLKSADFIVTNSKGTSDKLKRLFNVQTHQIINPSVSSAYYKRNKDEINVICEKYDIKSDYLLFVGNLEPRKNLVMVINSFIELIQEKKICDIKLLIVGLKGWKNNTVYQLINQYSDYIQLLGYVDENDLPAIYSQAKIFVFPSLYEGFGIPVREALMCGTSVITSDIQELREAGEIATNNEQVSYINPNNKEELKNSIVEHLHIVKKENFSNEIQKIEISNLIKFITK